MNGVSKKLCITALSIGVIVSMSEGAADKWHYAVIVGVICIAYKVIQGFIDWKRKND